MVTPQVLSAVIRAARPAFRGGDNRLAFAIHSFLIADGYKVVAVGSKADSECLPNGGKPEELPEVDLEGWTGLENAYAFQYVDEAGKRPPLMVKIVVVGEKLLVSSITMSEANAEPQSLELDIPNYVKPSAPADGSQYYNLDKLVTVLNKGLKGPSTASTLPADEKKQEIAAQGDPLRVDNPPATSRPERAAFYPDDDVSRGLPVGARDLYPPPLLGEGPGYPGFLPPTGIPRGGGGMHVGPDDPLFGGHPGLRPPGSHFPGGHPPGGRWDPIAPPGMQGFRPGDFQTDHRPQPHPDIMPPGPGGPFRSGGGGFGPGGGLGGSGFDDSMYG